MEDNMGRYYKAGFTLDNLITNQGLIYVPVAGTTSIAKGSAVFDDGNGYAVNGTAFAATFLGIAAADANNNSGAAGAIEVPVIPPNDQYTFWVPNGSSTKAAQTDVGEIVDLEHNYDIDVTDTTCVQWGFRIDEIDISAEAVAVNAGGYVKGRFVRIGA